MTAQPYQIEIITNPGDLERWTLAQYASFQNTNNVIHDIIFPPASPSPPPLHHLTTSTNRHITSLTTDPTHNIYIQITDPANPQKIMGGAKWQFWPADPQRPATHPVTFVDASTEQGRIELEFTQRVMNDFTGARARDMAMPHGLLDICFTVPEYERRGVARALVRWGLDRCDAEGWVGFTEASVRGAPVYERLGFQRGQHYRLRYDELGDYAKGMGDVEWIFMKRPAKDVESN